MAEKDIGQWKTNETLDYPSWWHVPPRQRILCAIREVTQERGSVQKTSLALGLEPKRLSIMFYNATRGVFPRLKFWLDLPADTKKNIWKITGYSFDELISKDFLDRASKSERHGSSRAERQVAERIVSALHPDTEKETVFFKKLWPKLLALEKYLPAEYRLSLRQKDILAMRYGLFGGSEKTFEEIGAHYRTRQDNTRRQHNKALYKLRRHYLPLLNR